MYQVYNLSSGTRSLSPETRLEVIIAPMPVTIRAPKSNQGAGARPSPKAPTEVIMIPKAIKDFFLVMASNHSPMGIRNINWGMAYAPTIAPTMDRLAPIDWEYTGKTGT